jgi:hypothetical protein
MLDGLVFTHPKLLYYGLLLNFSVQPYNYRRGLSLSEFSLSKDKIAHGLEPWLKRF